MTLGRTLLLASLLLATATPFVPGAAAQGCIPGKDADALTLPAGDLTYYLRVYRTSAYTIEELWQEANGVQGLQLTGRMSCIDVPDRMVKASCIGLCPIPF